MSDERKVPLAELTPEADEAMSLAIIRDCIAKRIPKGAELVNRFTEISNGDLRVRTFMGDIQISEVIIDKTLWHERAMN